MRFQNMIHIGAVALLSVTMVACKSKDTTANQTTTPTQAPVATQSTPDTGPPPKTPEQLRQEQMKTDALAKTVFYFEFDKSDLSAEARDALVYHAQDLKDHPNMRIRLEGHADERGTREYNLALGERRAQAVERYLQVQGVPASQMSTISYGEERPAVQGTTEAAYSKNRRVELKKQ